METFIGPGERTGCANCVLLEENKQLKKTLVSDIFSDITNESELRKYLKRMIPLPGGTIRCPFDVKIKSFSLTHCEEGKIFASCNIEFEL